MIISLGDEFKIEIRGTNHPFVCLRNKSLDQYSLAFAKMKSSPQYFSDDTSFAPLGSSQVVDFNKNLSTLRYLIVSILQEFTKMDSKSLLTILANQYNYIFYPYMFGCDSFEAFLNKYESVELDLKMDFEAGTCMVNLKSIMPYSNKPFHYKFDTFPNANFVNPNIPSQSRSIMNSVDITEDNPNKQVTYQFVDQLDVINLYRFRLQNSMLSQISTLGQ